MFVLIDNMAPRGLSASENLAKGPKQQLKMRFNAQLKNIGTFQKLTAALSSLEKIAWVRLDNNVARFTAIPDVGSHVWASFNMDVIFDDFTISSKERALKSALNSVSASMKLAKRRTDGVPILAMTITTQTNSSTSAAAAAAMPPPPPPPRGAPDSSSVLDDSSSVFPIENLETSLRREREKIITHEIPVRVLYPESLKAIADRFTRLTAAASSSSSSSRSGAKLELSANMFGGLRLRVRTDGGTVSSEWSGLVTPELNQDQMSIPIEEHPSTRFREAGPDRWATVRVDGKDLSRVLSVGRLEGKVIGSFIDDHALILYCYISHFDEHTMAEESVMTYYVQSYAQ
ncbi:unnamed protein product [Parascedosporium putredinis]|uniref:Checkpoint protein n=1 Tax=Parascedosporium putredinis TaxID=1442378 RepID=A0A9P1GUC9_9PEZI|nr:unnamed protein product [Parascedosporium putredinis]CAI7987540.1 unnamed protein product [Parascedosporium putredinis]